MACIPLKEELVSTRMPSKRAAWRWQRASSLSSSLCEVARERKSRIRLALCLIGLGLFEAIYGLAEYLAGWQYIWNVPRRFYLGSATGTYINHNHFAGLLEMILPLALGLAFYFWQCARHRSRRRTWRSFLEFIGQPEIVKCFLLLLVAAVLLVAIVFSFSRMGMISGLVSLGAMAAIVWIGRRRSQLPVTLIVLLLAGGIAIAVWVGVGPVVEHFEQLPQNEPLVSTTRGRVAVWNDSLKLVRAHPWTGIGLGCFEYAFTAAQSTQLAYIVDHAHNDYLELVVELGLPFASILLAGILWLAAAPLRASLERTFKPCSCAGTGLVRRGPGAVGARHSRLQLPYSRERSGLCGDTWNWIHHFVRPSRR